MGFTIVSWSKELDNINSETELRKRDVNPSSSPSLDDIIKAGYKIQNIAECALLKQVYNETFLDIVEDINVIKRPSGIVSSTSTTLSATPFATSSPNPNPNFIPNGAIPKSVSFILMTFLMMIFVF